MMEEAIARYVLRHSVVPLVVGRPENAYLLAQFVGNRPRVVGTDDAVGDPGPIARYKQPSMVFWSKCPTVETRMEGSKWPQLTRKQSGWTNYVFGPDFVFPQDRKLIFASPPPTGDAKMAYLDHAQALAPEPPLAILSDVEKAAKIAGATVIDEPADPELAAQSAGNRLDAVHIGDGFAAFHIDKATVVPILACVGPDHRKATKLFDDVLDHLDAVLFGGSQEDTSSSDHGSSMEEQFNHAADQPAFLREHILNPILQRLDPPTLLDHHSVFLVTRPPTALFPLYDPEHQQSE